MDIKATWHRKFVEIWHKIILSNDIFFSTVSRGGQLMLRPSMVLGLLAPVNLFAATRGANTGQASDLIADATPAMVVLSVIGTILIVFLAIRHFWLWYWKINQIEAHLAELVNLQRKAIKGKE